MKEQASLLENALSLLSQKDKQIRGYEMSSGRKSDKDENEDMLRQRAAILASKNENYSQQQALEEDAPQEATGRQTHTPRSVRKKKSRPISRGTKSNTNRVSFPPQNTENRLEDIIERFAGTEKGRGGTPSHTRSRSGKSTPSAKTSSARSAPSSQGSKSTRTRKRKTKSVKTPSKRLSGDTVSSGVRVLSTLGGPTVASQSTPAKKKSAVKTPRKATPKKRTSSVKTPRSRTPTPRLQTPPPKKSSGKTPEKTYGASTGETSFNISSPSRSYDSNERHQSEKTPSGNLERALDRSGYNESSTQYEQNVWPDHRLEHMNYNPERSQQYSNSSNTEESGEYKYSPVSIQTYEQDSWEDSASETEGQLSFFSPKQFASSGYGATPDYESKKPNKPRTKRTHQR